MIGGADIVLPGRPLRQEGDLLLRTMRTEWPNARVQLVDSAAAVPFSEVHFPVMGPKEFIVYRDSQSFEAWRAHGATPENQATMVHFIVSEDSVTIVVDHEASQLAAMAREMLDALLQNRIMAA